MIIVEVTIIVSVCRELMGEVTEIVTLLARILLRWRIFHIVENVGCFDVGIAIAIYTVPLGVLTSF